MDADCCCATRIVKFIKDPEAGTTAVTFETVCLRTNQVRVDNVTTSTLAIDADTAAAAWAVVAGNVCAWSDAITPPPQTMVGKTLDTDIGAFV